MGNKKPYRPKAVTLERRFIDQRSKIFKALLQAEKELNVNESLVLLQELLDSYIDLVRLKLAYQETYDSAADSRNEPPFFP